MFDVHHFSVSERVARCCGNGQNQCVAILLPAEFDLTSLEDSEQQVCNAFLNGLDDTWYVVPHVPITADGRDSEIDVVLVSAVHGVVCVEVKGGLVSVKNGTWYQYEREMKQSPVSQVMKAKHDLLKRCRTVKIDVNVLPLRHIVALPHVGTTPPEGLGAEAPAEIVFSRTQLAFPEEALERVLKEKAPIPPDVLEKFLLLLRPDIELDGTEGRVLMVAASRLEDETRVHLNNVVALDSNRRVMVTGGAGTGKTMLVVKWARRAVRRGERTLVVCFNKPIAGGLQQQLERESLTVSTFHDAIIKLLEPHGFRVGGNPTPEYWRDAITDALEFHAAAVGTPFDTIVIDEAQDFSPAWLAQLTQLLDPAGPARLLMVADESQGLYRRGFTMPRADDGWTRCELINNCRNTSQIATMLRRQLGGAPPPVGGPEAEGITWIASGTLDEAAAHVGEEIDRIVDGEGHDPTRVLVATLTRAVRDRLRDDFAFVAWEGGEPATIICETVHRVKGLEFDYVILVATDEDTVNDQLLYIGCSRAIAGLTIIAPTEVGQHLGLC